VANRVVVGKVAVMLAEARTAAGITVRELAPMVAKRHGGTIGPSFITDIEKGRSVPSDFVARQVAKIVGIDVNEFLQACAEDRRYRAEH
jgi:ribosome-binding protein aMBF1 (putative translation factor)